MVRRKAAETGDELGILQRIVPRDGERLQRPDLHLRNAREETVAQLDRQVAIDAAGDGARAVDLFACRGLDDLLAELPHQHGAAAELRLFAQHLEDVALRGRGLEAEQQVGCGEMKEVQHVALHHLAIMHQPPHLLGRRRQHIDAGDLVHRLGARQVMAYRADAAQALDDDRHLPVQPPVDETLEAAELDDVQPRLVHLVVAVEVNCHLAVSFDAGHRRNLDQTWLGHGVRLSRQSKWMACGSKPSNRPSSS